MTSSQRRGDPYAGIPGRRLFVGVPLPDEATAAIADIVESVRAAGLPPGDRDVRWVRLDGLHLTLRFLGPTPDELIAPTADAVEAAAAGAPGPLDLELGGTGTFPSADRPRTLWIGLRHGADALARLAAGTETTLARVGWPAVDRPFRPHLTLARSDGVRAGPLVAGRLAAAMGERGIAFRVDRLGLFESITGGGPARYVPVTMAPLGPLRPNGTSVYHRTTPDPT